MIFEKQINWIKEKWKAFWKWILVIGGGVVLVAQVTPAPIPAEYITAPENNTYKIGVMNYDVELASDINFSRPLQYKLDDKYFSLKPVGMKVDGVDIKSIRPSSAIINKKNYYYKDIFGEGIDLDMNFGDRVWNKIVKIDSLNRLGNIEKAENIEIWFELETNFIIDGWNRKDKLEITDKVRLGDFSYIEPAIAWDSYSEEVCEQVPFYDDTDTIIEGYIEECETLTNRVKIKSFLSEDKGKLYLTKQISVEWLKTAQYPIYTDTDITYGTASEFSNNYDSDVLDVSEISSDKVAVIYGKDGGAGYDDEKVLVGTVSGTTITWGTAVPLYEFDYIENEVGICKIDTDKFAVVYPGSYQAGFAEVCTVSGTTITEGTPVEFETGDVNFHSVSPLGTDKFVAVYMDDSNSDRGTACVCTVSGTTITKGTPSIFETGITKMVDSCQLNTDKFIAAYVDDSDGDKLKLVVATVSTRTPTWGTIKDIEANTPGVFQPLSIISHTNDAFVCAYSDENGAASKVIAGTVSGTTITLGTPVEYNSPGLGYAANVAKINGTQVLLTYSDSQDGYKGKSRVLNISGTTITLGDEETFSNSDIFQSVFHSANRSTAGALLSSNKIIICFKDDTNGDDGYCIVGDVAVAPSGTNMQINIGDVWKDVEAMQINIGDAWKAVEGAWINIGDAWKVIY